jgi:hypothetical protein
LPKPSSSLADDFVRHLRALEHTRRKVEALCARARVVRRDVEHVYGSIYFSAVTSFESLIEDLFFGLLVGRLKARSGVRPRVRFNSETVARIVVLRERNYIDWLPYERTKQLAEVFFTCGRPFTSPDDNDTGVLSTILTIRNALAHKSTFARKKFQDKVLGTTPLLPCERTPTGFLRSPLRVAPVQTRYEQLVSELSRLAYKLCG